MGNSHRAGTMGSGQTQGHLGPPQVYCPWAAFPLLGPTSGGRVPYPSFSPTLIHTGREEHSPLPKLMPYVES